MNSTARRKFSEKTLLICLLMFSLTCSATELTISAASSLSNVFKELGQEFTLTNQSIKLNFNFAGSGQLLQQINQGAPVDVFASADQETMNQAQQSGLLSSFRRDFAKNSLVLITPASSNNAPSSAQLISKYDKIAIALPASVPVGKYTKEALTREGIWSEVATKMIAAQNVRQVLDYVARGEVDAGFVYLTDALLMPDKVRVVLHLNTSTAIIYPIAITASSKNFAAGEKFINFILSAKGQQILSKHRFAKP